MSLFRPTTSSNEFFVSPFFRLADELARNNASNVSPNSLSFSPKFDVRETASAYELHGDLPGMSRENLHVEWTDHRTLNVSGRIERSHSSSSDQSPPTEVVDTQAATEGTEKKSDEKPGRQVNKSEKKKKGHQHRYWVSERSVGEFHRAFQLPDDADRDSVTASLRDGVLAIRVPKIAKKEGARRITVD